MDVFNDHLRPGEQFMPDPEVDTRYAAVAEVLCCIPEEDYQTMTERWDSFQWFIPHIREDGMNYPFVATVDPEPETGIQLAPHSHVLYLSPMLEGRAWSYVLAVVAHETAHLVLDHPVLTRDDEVYEDQENEARELVRRWGFGIEAREHERYNRWRDSWEETLVRKLMKEAGRKEGG
jgi:hypothetical protein